MKKVAVLVIHGMGSQDINFAEGMIEEINNRISNLSKNPDEIAWKPIFWADLLEPRQKKYLRNAKRNHDLDYIGLREFVLTALGDATAYQKVESTENNIYDKMHRRVQERINELYKVDLQNQECPLIIMAHSLGGYIMSNYIWDIQESPNSSLSAFENMELLAGMITFGCNIPLFTFAYNDVVPIQFPGKALSDEIKSKAKWENYYDPDDILAYPLKAINPAYKKIVKRDIPINVGGFLSSWNPASHAGYWTDNNFTKPASKFISKYL